MKTKISAKTREEQITALKKLKDENIDYSDIPETTDSTGWKRLYPKAKKGTVITQQMIFDAIAAMIKG